MATDGAAQSPTEEAAVQPLDEAARAKLSAKQLAQAVLQRRLRPRVGEIRALAEAVLAKDSSGAKKKKTKPKKAAPKGAAGNKGSAKKGGKKGKRKLAKIPKPSA